MEEERSGKNYAVKMLCQDVLASVVKTPGQKQFKQTHHLVHNAQHMENEFKKEAKFLK